MGRFIRNKLRRLENQGVDVRALRNPNPKSNDNSSDNVIQPWVKKNYKLGDKVIVKNNLGEFTYECCSSHNALNYNYYGNGGFIEGFNNGGVYHKLWCKLYDNNNNKTLSLAEFINNKNVIIVGPSPIILNQSLGSFIDGFDVIVKMNGGLDIKNEIDYGNRCDVLYTNTIYTKTNTEVIVDKCINFGVKFLRTKIKNNILIINNNINISSWGNFDYNKLFDIKNPLTGLCVIYEMINFGVKSITLTGFDFYENENNSVYVDGYLPECFNYNKKIDDENHNYLKQKKIINGLINSYNIKLINNKTYE